MGNIFCVDKSTPRNKNSSFKYDESYRGILPQVAPVEQIPPAEQNRIESNEESKAVLTNPISMPKKREPEEKAASRTLPIETLAVDLSKRARNTSAPLLNISYTLNVKEDQTILVDEALVDALMTTIQDAEPISPKFSLSRRSDTKLAKKTNIKETVTINRIASADMVGSKVKSELYKTIILLKEIWTKLDLDGDNHLNVAELKRFCIHVWEEPVDDAGAGVIMSTYAKLNPEQGLNFNEWCLVIKDEDPRLEDFVEELFEIFVDTSRLTNLLSEEHKTPTCGI